MNAIKTTLTTSGNSTAVRLPKELLKMSGLTRAITLEAQEGAIIIRKANSPHEGWSKQIKALIAKGGDPTLEFSDMDVAASDGLDDLTWDGLSFEEWQKTNAKLS